MSFGGMRDIGWWAESRGKKDRAVKSYGERKMAAARGGVKREVRVMARGGRHAV